MWEEWKAYYAQRVIAGRATITTTVCLVFLLASPRQSDSMIRSAVKESDSLQLLKGYVEEVEIDIFGNILKLYDKNGAEIVPIEKGEGKLAVECALYPEGDACALLFHTLNELSRAENISPQARIQQYFEDKGEEFFRKGGYIIIADIATELGMKGGRSVGYNLKHLKETLPDDHFIHKIKGSGRWIGGKNNRIYHFKVIEPQIIEPQILKPEQEKIKKYLEDIGEQFFLDGGYIIIADIATELGMKSGKSVGNHLMRLKKKLPNDHFIHKIKGSGRWIGGKGNILL